MAGRSAPGTYRPGQYRDRSSYPTPEQHGVLGADDAGFRLVSTRHEHASLILTRNLPFSGWGTVFGDQAVAAAMIDRIVHHADVLTLKGASYRLKNLGIDTLPSVKAEDQTH